MEFGEFLRQKRVQRGVTQAQLAEALSFSNKSDIARRESGKRNHWNIDQLKALAAFFGITLGELFTEYEQEEN